MKKRERGILTVEASIVLTLFLFFVLFIFSFARVYRAQNMVSHAAIQAVDAVALESYLRETALEADANDVLFLTSKLTGSSSISADSFTSLRAADIPKIAKEKFTAAISNSETKADEILTNLGVKNGLAGIDFSYCTVDLGKDDVIVTLSYTIEMQFPVFGGTELSVTKSAKAKTFGDILFSVTTDVNNPGWGTTKGDDKVVHGSKVQISAEPNYGYKFVGWDSNGDGVVDVTDKNMEVIVDDAKHYTAVFKKDKFGVNVSVNNASYGTATGGGTFDYLDVAKLKANAKDHYYFDGWDTNGDGKVDVDRSGTPTTDEYSIAVDKTYFVKAIFKPKKYTITVKSNDVAMGIAQVMQGKTVGTSISADYGSKVTLIATPKGNGEYKFINWSDSNTGTTHDITVKGNATYTANFEFKASIVIVGGSTGGMSTTLKAVTVPSNAKVSWKSSNDKIVSVNQSGKITAKDYSVSYYYRNGTQLIESIRGNGTVKITASFVLNGKTYSASKSITTQKSVTLKYNCYRKNTIRQYYKDALYNPTGYPYYYQKGWHWTRTISVTRSQLSSAKQIAPDCGGSYEDKLKFAIGEDGYTRQWGWNRTGKRGYIFYCDGYELLFFEDKTYGSGNYYISEIR